MFSTMVAVVIFCAVPSGTGPAELTREQFGGHLDDCYYPQQEAAQRAALKIPTLAAIGPREALLAAAPGAQSVRVPVGGELDGWQVVETLDQPQPLAVLQREFSEWGLFVYLGRQGVVAEIRKAIGRMDGPRPKPLRFPKSYFEDLLAAKEDVLGRKMLASGKDPGYEDLAGYLAPLETYTILGSPESARKYTVDPDGSIGDRLAGARKVPLLSRTVLDPCPAARGLEPAGAKRGLLGRFLPAIDYGFRDASGRFGWELCALMDVGPSSTVFVRTRRADGRTTFYRLEPLQELPDGKPFFAALLRLHQSWQAFFARGMQLEIGDRRAADASRAGIVRALSSYVGLHPKYGMGAYWEPRSDGFPPQTISLCTCLLDWGFAQEAKDRLGYYLDRFVKPDGTFDYYGPAVSEYGQVLEVAARCVRQTGDFGWFSRYRQPIERMVAYLLDLRARGKQSQSPDAVTYGLLFGSPEADTRKETNYYFSGSAWSCRGLREIGRLWTEAGRRQNQPQLAERGKQLLAESESLRVDLLRAAERSLVPGDPPFLPPFAGPLRPFDAMTHGQLASYTNYRYWPEAVSAGCLGERYERAMLDYRRTQGGELLATTRFANMLDDWPYWHQAWGMLADDRVPQYLLGYFAHMAHHQMPGTFTAYEGVAIGGNRVRSQEADYCVPSQLTVPLMTRWMLAFEDRDSDALWLCRGVPRAWIAQGLAFSGASTRWGPVALRLQPSAGLRRFTARITLAGPNRPTVLLRVRHPDRNLRIVQCDVSGGVCRQIDAGRELVRLQPTADTMTAELTFSPTASRQ